VVMANLRDGGPEQSTGRASIAPFRHAIIIAHFLGACQLSAKLGAS
jgi:hypothetical protein